MQFNLKHKKIQTTHFKSLQTRIAFTLAEVLITLGIIGVVASLTIPTIIAKQEELATITALKKAQSVLSQAFLSAISTNGTPDTWGISTDYTSGQQGAIDVLNIISPLLKITHQCTSTSTKCWASSIKWLNSTSVENINTSPFWASAQLLDGMNIGFLIRSTNCKDNSLGKNDVCGDIQVDINGNKPPNKFGRDNFRFLFTKDGLIIPKGTQNATLYTFNNYCISGNGEGCAAWVIYNENMDYLHCPSSLSWNGNHSCP